MGPHFAKGPGFRSLYLLPRLGTARTALCCDFLIMLSFP